MSFTDISEALYGSVIGALPPGWEVAWENMGYEPRDGVAYARVSMPANIVSPGLGSEGLNTHMGIFELSLFYPLGTGTSAITAAADTVASVFKRGTTHTKGLAQVRIESISRGPLLYDKAWVQLPLNIRWRCHLGN